MTVCADAPYLAPVPHRGGTNEPSFVAHTAAKVAEVRGISLEQVGAEFHKTITSEVATLRRMLEGQKGAVAADEEPALPSSADRFLTQPVKAR